MKRYDLDGYDAGMVEYEGGKYVEYDEAAAIERQRDRAVELLRKAHDAIDELSAEVVTCRYFNLEDDIDALLIEIDKDASK